MYLYVLMVLPNTKTADNIIEEPKYARIRTLFQFKFCLDVTSYLLLVVAFFFFFFLVGLVQGFLF